MDNQPPIIALREALAATIVGQTALLDRLIIGLLAGGHILVEGLPGLAKTTAIKTLAAAVHASFKRIQFTPDLLPGDLTGTDIYDSRGGGLAFVEGPLFNEIILADEINRAPAKVQSALLEAMQEHQITVGGETRRLPDLFMVMATQNPLEQAGTYALPEAQLDRFLLHVTLDYPSAEEEFEILRRGRTASGEDDAPAPVIDVATVLCAREEVKAVHMDEMLERYIVTLVGGTRGIAEWIPDYTDMVEVGASPRASLALARAAAASAYLKGRDYVLPDDIIDMAPDCLRHRIVTSLQARMEGVSAGVMVDRLLAAVPVP